MSEPLLQISDGEMAVFRQVLSTHLLSTTMYELIPISGKVWLPFYFFFALLDVIFLFGIWSSVMKMAGFNIMIYVIQV